MRVAAAKAFAWANHLPLVPVNHMAGHLWAARQVKIPLEFPLMALLVSGGQVHLFGVAAPGDYKSSVKPEMMLLAKPTIRLVEL